MNNKAAGTLLGFLAGVFILHPLSMVVQEVVHPDAAIRLSRLVEAFNAHHLPMAAFFGVLGALFGLMNMIYVSAVTKEKHRVRMLESLLPICAYCKKIRDDSNSEKGKGEWVNVDRYISSKTDTVFTHGMCPECYEKIIGELDKESDGTPRNRRAEDMTTATR